jgi:hypothetical protein
MEAEGSQPHRAGVRLQDCAGPLLTLAPKLSKVVSVVEGIKKRHGILIEDALIAAINFVPGWKAFKGVFPVSRKGSSRLTA